MISDELRKILKENGFSSFERFISTKIDDGILVALDAMAKRITKLEEKNQALEVKIKYLVDGPLMGGL